KPAMVVRTLHPFGFEAGKGIRPSNLRMAVGVSLAVHLAAGLYLAYTHFAPPVQQHEPAERIFVVPFVNVRPDPPKPVEHPKTPPAIHPPAIRDAPPIKPIETTPPPPSNPPI